MPTTNPALTNLMRTVPVCDCGFDCDCALDGLVSDAHDVSAGKVTPDIPIAAHAIIRMKFRTGRSLVSRSPREHLSGLEPRRRRPADVRCVCICHEWTSLGGCQFDQNQ